MPLDPGSAVLTALYQQKREEAERLAAQADLTIAEAAALGRNDRIRELLDSDPPLVHRCAPDGHFPLGLAAFFGPASTVRLLLDRGADVHAVARNEMRVQPLHAAVAAGNAEAVTLLLERGADPNARQQLGYTPLMGGAAAGRDEIVRALLDAGSDPALANDEGKTAAAIARERGHAAIAALLDAAAASRAAAG